jgi:hypothetical protein
MPSSPAVRQGGKEILPPKYDEVQIVYKGKTAERPIAKELTVKPKTVNRTLLFGNLQTTSHFKIPVSKLQLPKAGNG